MKNGHRGPICRCLGAGWISYIQAHARIKQRQDECSPPEAFRATQKELEREFRPHQVSEWARARACSRSLARRWSPVPCDLLRPEEIWPCYWRQLPFAATDGRPPRILSPPRAPLRRTSLERIDTGATRITIALPESPFYPGVWGGAQSVSDRENCYSPYRRLPAGNTRERSVHSAGSSRTPREYRHSMAARTRCLDLNWTWRIQFATSVSTMIGAMIQLSWLFMDYRCS